MLSVLLAVRGKNGVLSSLLRIKTFILLFLFRSLASIIIKTCTIFCSEVLGRPYRAYHTSYYEKSKGQIKLKFDLTRICNVCFSVQHGCSGATYHINAEHLFKKVCHTTCSHPAFLFLTKATASETLTFKPKKHFSQHPISKGSY